MSAIKRHRHGSPVNRSGGQRTRLERDERRLRRRLLGAALISAAIASLVLAVPSLRQVATAIEHMGAGWIVLAIVLELASGVSFAVIFRLFFDGVPAPVARELAWTEMASGALMPGGGVGAYAVGGWLLHRAGISTRRILKRSSGLFFLTSATNVAAMAVAGALLAAALGRGPSGFLRTVVPIIAAVTATAVVLALPVLFTRRHMTAGWLRDQICGVPVAERALASGSWRLLGALGYLGFDIAVLGVTMAATGHPLPVPALVLAYIIGYLANLIPIPGAVGVLEGGLAGMLILYGAPATQAAAAVLVYHAIAFWIPSLGGIAAYWRLRCRLREIRTQPKLAAGHPSQPQDLAPRFAEPCGLRRRRPVRGVASGANR